MSNLIAHISRKGEKIEFIGDRSIHKLNHLSDGEPIFAVSPDEGFKKQGVLFLYNKSNAGPFPGVNNFVKKEEYGFRFIPKSCAVIRFEKSYALDENKRIPLRIEMARGFFGFKGYRKIMNLLTDESLLKTEIQEVNALDENFLDSVQYRVYSGRSNALFGINSCLGLSLEKVAHDLLG